MMVSLGAIDKMGHMWGPEDRGEKGAEPGSVEEMRHMPFVAKNADEQVGQIVDALRTKGQLDETLIVITADHAAQTGNPFFGVLAPGVTNPRCTPAVDRHPVRLQLVLRPGRGRGLPRPEPGRRGPTRQAAREPRVLVPGHARSRRT